MLLEETAKVIHHQAAESHFQEGQPWFPASPKQLCVPPCSIPALARLVRRIIQGPTATEEGLPFLQGCFSAVLAPWTGLLPVWAVCWGGNWLQCWVEEGLGAMLLTLDSLRVEEQHHKPESYPASKHWACSAWISSDLLLCSCIAPQLLSPWMFLEPALLAIWECEKVLCIEVIWE